LDLLEKDRNQVSKVHLMGIGGAGMSGLALLLSELGYEVSGCDVSHTSYVERITQKGIDFVIGHKKEHLESYVPDLLIYSSAIPEANEELLKAKELGVPVAKRAEVLSWLFNRKFGIGVAGTHGKTTTSSMIAMILEEAGLQPTVAIGGELCDIGVNAKLGRGPYMVAELDESDGSFEEFHPAISIVTNADWDHVDHYPSLDSVITAYKRFINKTKPGGVCVLCGEDPGLNKLIGELSESINMETYGFGTSWDWGAYEISHQAGGGVTFSVCHKGKHVTDMSLSVSGDHNILNALAATVVARKLNIPFSFINDTLGDFKGAKRRLQYMGQAGSADIYDDYGHHPREVAATLNTLDQMFPSRRHVVVFQPHRFTRTAAMFKEFSEVLTMADRLFLMPVYPADEKPIEGVSSKLICDCLDRCGYTRYNLCKDFEDATSHLYKELQKDDVILTIGAGNVSKIGEMIKERWSAGKARLQTDI